MEKIDLTKCVNCRFRAKVDGNEVEGRIAVEGDYLQFYYRYGRNESCYSMLISFYWVHGKVDYFDGFEIVPRDPETYQDWQVGDIIWDSHESGDNGKVIFRNGEFVAAEIIGMCRCYTCQELFKDGYRLVLTDIETRIIEEKRKQKYEPQDGDIVAWSGGESTEFAISIYKEKTYTYITLFTNGECNRSPYPKAMKIIRPATEDEKQKLFDAMAKEGKRWNAEKKVVEDIPKPYEFKKGEPVLVRDDQNERWKIRVFEQIREGKQDYPYLAIEGIEQCREGYKYCIPYNERTMHLLGTREDYKEER